MAHGQKCVRPPEYGPPKIVPRSGGGRWNASAIELYCSLLSFFWTQQGDVVFGMQEGKMLLSTCNAGVAPFWTNAHLGFVRVDTEYRNLRTPFMDLEGHCHFCPGPALSTVVFEVLALKEMDIDATYCS